MQIFEANWMETLNLLESISILEKGSSQASWGGRKEYEYRAYTVSTHTIAPTAAAVTVNIM